MYEELIVIPARFKSTRLPGKPLVDIAGKPMILRTAERCLSVLPREQVIVATDDDRIAEVCSRAGLRVEMTSDHPTGGDRVAEVATRVPAQTYINVQGDEPVFNPDDIRTIIEVARRDRTKTLIGYCPMEEAEWYDTKFPKVLFGLNEQLIYIGRAPVPGSHDGKFHFAYRQVCIYAYPGDALAAFTATGGRTPLEALEDHEIVRFLDLGLPVHVVRLSAESIAVDRVADIARVEARLAATDVGEGADMRRPPVQRA